MNLLIVIIYSTNPNNLRGKSEGREDVVRYESVLTAAVIIEDQASSSGIFRNAQSLQTKPLAPLVMAEAA